MTQTPRRNSMLESPWYWVYAFAAAGLAALLLMGPKFIERQAQIERSTQGRTRAAEKAAGLEPETEMSTPGDTQIALWPLYVLLAAVFVIAWAVVWVRYFWRRREDPGDDADDTPAGASPHGMGV